MTAAACYVVIVFIAGWLYHHVESKQNEEAENEQRWNVSMEKMYIKY